MATARQFQDSTLETPQSYVSLKCFYRREEQRLFFTTLALMTYR